MIWVTPSVKGHGDSRVIGGRVCMLNMISPFIVLKVESITTEHVFNFPRALKQMEVLGREVF